MYDGTASYVLSQSLPAGQAGAGGMPFPGDALTRVGGADDFFTREIAVAVPGLDGVVHEVITIRYYGEQHEIAAPESYLSCRRRRWLRRPHP